MYLSFYKLSSEPFLLTPDPRFLHLAEAHRSALLSLTKGVLERKGFMVMTGAVGTGKTTLLNTMLQFFTSKNPATGKAFCQQKVHTALIVNPVLTRDEFLENVLDELEIPCESASKVKRVAALNERLAVARGTGGTTVLIIDEAHLLSPELLEEIRLLANFDSYTEKLLQVVLCGQAELATLLLHPQLKALRQRISLLVNLRALTVTETRQYIEQRLAAGGLAGPNPFTGPALETVHRSAKGVPRLINAVCDAAMAVGHTANRKEIGPDIINEAVSRLSVLNLLTETAANEQARAWASTN